ncbi:monovalent cation/H+ antiporter subunit D [Jannaschia sp. W003]|uniref:monovalent cation/H+ antiporter subunit D n=1 Tax=Jannaschia sp. W003 TaxID=2867012 RepID=UPI0021A4F396|nr:monovalent cation/H+ antiporter subunit D [Jannaschia sp. W003]UWQ21913.1 monovalent cation/H+ antiporter subunit D [Jannaschia sp. W003]
MSHWSVVPIVLPAFLASFIILAARHHVAIQRVVSVGGTAVLLLLSVALAWEASDGTVTLYRLGDWAAPFGIVLVADRLSTLMLVLTCALALPVLLYAVGSGWDARGKHFHALFQFQLMGILGAFLTGDLFNLFVFFEVLLIASYGLMIHAGGTARLRAGTQYVLYNLLGSTLFLFAMGALYAETGTLNMADLAGRVALIGPEGTAGIRVAAVLLLLVFAVKAALVPLHFWLPSSYAEAPAPVAALFAIMTKVGAYSIIRVFTLIFPPGLEATAGLHGAWLLPLALVSVAVGMVGVLAARRLDRLVAFAVIGSMGMVMTAISLFTAAGISAALYYVVHSTLAAGALFLVVDLVAGGRGQDDTAADVVPRAGATRTAALFFAAAIAMVGLPPLSGFIGKLLILDAAFGRPGAVWVWAVVLGTSLVAMVGFARAGSAVFWRGRAVRAADVPADPGAPVEAEAPAADPRPAPPALGFAAVGMLVALLVLHTAFAGPITAYADAVSRQLLTPTRYVATVLETPGRLWDPAAARVPTEGDR